MFRWLLFYMRPFALPTVVLVAALLVGGASGDCTGSDGPRNNLLQKMNMPKASPPQAPAALPLPLPPRTALLLPPPPPLLPPLPPRCLHSHVFTRSASRQPHVAGDALSPALHTFTVRRRRLG